jgi:PAS domain S-box-containing protein
MQNKAFPGEGKESLIMNAILQHTLLKLFEQVGENPDIIPPLPIDDCPQESEQRRLLAGFRDMLEQIQKHHKEKLEIQDRFSLAVEGANDGLWVQYLQSNVAYFSFRWKSMLGYEDHEISDMVEEWLSRLHPDDVERVLTAGQAKFESETDTNGIEYSLRHKDGTYRWVLSRATTERDAEGKPYRMAGSNTDITERKLAEEQLREKEEQYRSIFEATTDGLFIFDLENGQLVELNPAACRMHGYTYQEFLTLSQPRTYIHSDARPAFDQFLQFIKEGKAFQAQTVSARKDGTVFPIEIHGAGFMYKGKLHGMAVIRDITEQVQAQQLLEQRVEERTRELSTLLEVSHNVASTLQLKPLLGLILDISPGNCQPGGSCN